MDTIEDTQQRALEVPTSSTNWLIHSCTTPGCTVTIRVPIGEQHTHGICKWCREQRAYNTRNPSATAASVGPCLSIDEFGRDLFDAIKAQAGAIQALKTADLYSAKELPKEAERFTQQALICQKTLTFLLNKGTIAPGDISRILNLH